MAMIKALILSIKILTVLWNNCECDDAAGILDELNNVIVGELDDGAPIDCRDAISDM